MDSIVVDNNNRTLFYGKIDPKLWAINRNELINEEYDEEFKQTIHLLKKNSLTELEYAGLALTELMACYLRVTEEKQHIIRLRLPENKQVNMKNFKFLRGIVGVTINEKTKPKVDGYVLEIGTDFIVLSCEKNFTKLQCTHFNLVKTINDITHIRMALTLKKFVDGIELANPMVNLLFGYKPLSDPLTKIPEYNSDLSFSSQCNNNNIQEEKDVDKEKEKDIVWFNTKLNEYQKEAVEFALYQEHLAVIHGPPGTGKTTTLTELILQLITRDIDILVCAPSNVAVDNIFKQLLYSYKNNLCKKHSISPDKYSFIRIGNTENIDPEIWPYAFPEKKENQNNDKDKEEEEAIQPGKGLFNPNVIMSTLCNGSAELGPLGKLCDFLRKETFDVVIIDECAQASEPLAWIPLLYANKCILAGDNLQLPPTVKSKSKELELSLLERIVQGGLFKEENVVRLLKEQHRMNYAIMKWPSERFYNDKLIASNEAEFRHLTYNDGTCLKPLRLIDTTGCRFKEISIKGIEIFKTSKGNHHEAKIVYLVIEDFLKRGISPSNIGIITPYKLQNVMIEKICQQKFNKEILSQLEINSVDGFQGREKEIIIMSLVRSNGKGNLGFLKEHRRLNVAITRARSHFTMICDCNTIQTDKTYQDFIKYCRNNPSCINEKAEQYRNRMKYLPALDIKSIRKSSSNHKKSSSLNNNNGDRLE